MHHPDDDAEFVAHEGKRLIGDPQIVCSQSLTMPRLDSRASQPKARVSTEIQNGIKMQISTKRR